MYDAIGIGFFQVDNLVRTRVPFCLFTLEGTFENLYKGQELEHLKRYSIPVSSSITAEDADALVEQRKYRKIDPVLVVCTNGVASRVLADQLGRLGYLNCFYVEGGLERLERSARAEEVF